MLFGLATCDIPKIQSCQLCNLQVTAQKEVPSPRGGGEAVVRAGDKSISDFATK